MSRLVDPKPAPNPEQPYVVVPNWNGEHDLKDCLDSLEAQSLKPHIIVVDNGSVDNSVKFIHENYPKVELIEHKTNMGYAGGVNPGFKLAIERGITYVAPFNNDAVADKQWLKRLVERLDDQPELGIATCKILTTDGKRLDSTGDYYTTWGLPYPRGRHELDKNQYDDKTTIFAASGGASLYRVKTLKEIGLFDEAFFAYYEDVDLSFRAQLAGWKVGYEPTALAYHQIGGTSSKMKDFTVYQTMKNLQLLWYKNVPGKFMFTTGWRFTLAHLLFLLRAISRGQIVPAVAGDLRGTLLIMKARKTRKTIQKNKKVSDDYIWSMLVHDLPPNAKALRKLRAAWWKLLRRKK